VHFLSSFLALFLSVGAISGEIDSGALHAVLARPLGRAQYVLGRWLGLVALIAAFVGAISGEIDSGALHAVLARPLGRAEYVLGRWLGLVALVVAYVGAMAGALLILARAIAGYEPTDAARAIGLMTLGAVVLLTLSLLGSALLPTLANGVVVFSLFGLAWLAGVIEFVGNLIPNRDMVNVGIVVSLLVPSDAIWRAASFYVQSPAFLLASAAGGRDIPFATLTPPSVPFIAWSLLYVPVFLGFSVLAFRRRDL
jgi:ABC-type transport system involved in multi-copper enzyme maturation permease subunit